MGLLSWLVVALSLSAAVANSAACSGTCSPSFPGCGEGKICTGMPADKGKGWWCCDQSLSAALDLLPAAPVAVVAPVVAAKAPKCSGECSPSLPGCGAKRRCTGQTKAEGGGYWCCDVPESITMLRLKRLVNVAQDKFMALMKSMTQAKLKKVTADACNCNNLPYNDRVSCCEKKKPECEFLPAEYPNRPQGSCVATDQCRHRCTPNVDPDMCGAGRNCERMPGTDYTAFWCCPAKGPKAVADVVV